MNLDLLFLYTCKSSVPQSEEEKEALVCFYHMDKYICHELCSPLLVFAYLLSVFSIP